MDKSENLYTKNVIAFTLFAIVVLIVLSFAATFIPNGSEMIEKKDLVFDKIAEIIPTDSEIIEKKDMLFDKITETLGIK